MKWYRIKAKIKVFIKHYLFQIKVQGRLYLKQTHIYLFVIACILPCIFISGKYLEAVFLIFAFLILRYKFTTTYHADKTAKCLFITISVAYLAIPATVSFGTSLLQGIIVAFLVTFISWYVQAFIDVIAENKLLKEAIALEKEKSLEEMTDDEFVQFCLHKHLDDEEIKIAELFIRQKLKGQEFYNAIGYSMAQSKRKRKKILEKLNK